MGKMLMMLVTGVVLFGASAAASWFLRPAPEPVEEEQATNSQSINPPPPLDLGMTSTAGINEIPAGTLPAETVLRLTDTIRKREAQLKTREQLLEHRERQIKFMIDDLQRERLEVAALMQSAEQRAAEARSLLEQSQLSAPATMQGESGETTAADNTVATAPMKAPVTAENLRAFAKVLEEMPVEAASGLIQQLSKDGKMDMAAQLLDFLKERDAAKIISALSDNTLVAEIAEKMGQLQRPEKE
ncbi:MAG: hypothetical protein ACR2NP_05180 [Pirellulaceae bacterium]